MLDLEKNRGIIYKYLKWQVGGGEEAREAPGVEWGWSVGRASGAEAKWELLVEAVSGG